MIGRRNPHWKPHPARELGAGSCVIPVIRAGRRPASALLDVAATRPDVEAPMFSRFRRSRRVVGLDIGSSAIKEVELKPKDGGRSYELVSLGSEPLAPDSIVDGAIMDAASVADSIERLLNAQRIRSKDVATSLGGGAVIVKTISLPAMTPEELAESIYWEAEPHIPFDIREVSLDYDVIEPSRSGGTMQVLLVAAKKDVIAAYTSVIVRAGRTPVIVDVEAFALQNCHELNYEPDPDKLVALAAVGASRTSIHILRGSVSLFSRHVAIGGNAHTLALQRELNLPFGRAEDLKRSGASEGHSPSDVLAPLQAVSESLVAEMERTFGFFRSTGSGDRFERILVTGGASRTPGLIDLMRQRFAAQIEPLNPFRNVGCDPRGFAPGLLEEIAPSAAIAVGLAMRQAEER